MHFAFDTSTRCGTDESGTYLVALKGDRYGTIFDIRVAGTTVLDVWARRSERPPHDFEQRPSNGLDVHSVIAWVIDNRAGTSATILTLADPVGDRSLGEVMQSFLKSYEIAGRPEWDRAITLLKVECRGNQRHMMEDRLGP